MANDKKIIWKKAKKSGSLQTKVTGQTLSQNILSSDELHGLAQRSADHFSQKASKENKDESIADLKSEIEALFSDPQKSSSQTRESHSLNDTRETKLVKETPLKKESNKGSASTLAAMKVIEANKQKEQIQKKAQVQTITKDEKESNQEAVVEDLKKSINEDLRAPILRDQDREKKDDVQIARLLEKKEKAKGVGQTYYGDLSSAMGSNNPKTMSELLQKARQEKKIRAISSPFSRKNIAYIAGALILFAFVGAIASYLWKSNKEKNIEFVSEKRVPSLVYADVDTGINATIAETVKTKQAIRKVIEEKLPDDDLRHIYYVGKDDMGNLRRLGIKQVFEATDNIPPKLLYENIENDFMHGVYRTDKNEPFIILKALSYDRALEGMKEWEPTMIDDLSPYLDLPKEAGDRSLLEPGFSDDLINNKNVRVARFLPREVDRRNGVFDLFKSKKKQATQKDSDSSGEVKQENTLPQAKTLEQNDSNKIETVKDSLAQAFGSSLRRFVINSAEHVFAQTKKETQTTESADRTITAEPIQAETVKGDGGSESSSQAGVVNSVQFQGQDGNTVDIGGKNAAIGGQNSLDQQNLKKVCFDAQTGNRVEGEPKPIDFCFLAKQCWPYVCARGNTIISRTLEKNIENEGKPGVTCGKLQTPIPYKNIASYPGQKICSNFTELMHLKNIQYKSICFDRNGRYLEGFARNQRGDIPKDVQCIHPTERRVPFCLTEDNRIVYKGQFPGQKYKFCFDPLEKNMTHSLTEQFEQDYGVIQGKAALIAVELKTLSFALGLFGVDGAADTLNDASEFFLQVSFGNIQEQQATKQAIGIISRLERLLKQIDPDGRLSVDQSGNKTQIGKLRDLIDMIKQSFGYAHSVSWITLGNGYPRGFRLPQGGAIRAGVSAPLVTPIQQMMVQIGLMKEISVNGVLDLVTQDAISLFQKMNHLPQTGIIDEDTLGVLNKILAGKGKFFKGINGKDDVAIINNYLAFDASNTPGTLDFGLGSYGEDVQTLKIFLYAEGYSIDVIDPVFDSKLCEAVRSFQEDNDLEPADENTCSVSPTTVNLINSLLKEKGYLGSGFVLQPNGTLQGLGILSGSFGPGTPIDFTTKKADADSLREGDLVLLYTFLDEKTILIARNESVMNEIIKRRAFKDIFNK